MNAIVVVPITAKRTAERSIINPPTTWPRINAGKKAKMKVVYENPTGAVLLTPVLGFTKLISAYAIAHLTQHIIRK